MSTQKGRRILLGLVGAVTAATLVVPGAALAKGGPPDGGDEDPGEARFNLSVPALFVGGTYGLTCDGEATDPALEPPRTALVDDTWDDQTGSYWVQGENAWQAGCINDVDAGLEVTAEWGDNLAGDAKLKLGSPIRVEVGLFYTPAEGEQMTGWTVTKLDDDALDRVSDYGILAKNTGTTENPVWSSEDSMKLDETRVWDAEASLAIYDADGVVVLPSEPASAEINATGRVVYGYNLRLADLEQTETGNYVIQYTFPNLLIEEVDGGVISDDQTTISLTINVGGGGGKGGGGGIGGGRR